MAKFHFNMAGLIFQDGIDSMRQAYAVAVSALESELDRQKERAVEYQEYLDQGGNPIGEWEDRHTLWTQDQALEIEIGMAEERVQTLRKAFAVLLYHHWERTAQIIGKKANGGHAQLEKYMLKSGYTVDPNLEAVKDLANLIKHSSRKCGEALWQSAPHLLSLNAPPAWESAWATAILLTDSHMDWLFTTVSNSGPTSKSIKFEEV